MSKRGFNWSEDSKNKLIKINDINEKDEEGYILLHKAVLNADILQVVKLLKLGADPAILVTKQGAHAESVENNVAQAYNLQNGDNTMHLAMRLGNKDIVEILHAKNSNLFNMQNHYDLTPVDVAASVGNLEVINFFIDEVKPRLNQFKGNYNGLIYAIYNKHEEVSRILIENGWDINGGEGIGRSVISMAAYKLPSLVEILLHRGANINSSDYNGCTPIYDAIISKDDKLLKILVKNGAKLVVEGIEGVIEYAQRINVSKEILEILNISYILDIACGDNLNFDKNSLKQYVPSYPIEDMKKNVNSVGFDRVMHRILQRKPMSLEEIKSSTHNIIIKVTEFGEEYGSSSVLIDLINNLGQFSTKLEFFIKEVGGSTPSLFIQSYKVLMKEGIWDILVKEQDDYEKAKDKFIFLNNGSEGGGALNLLSIPRLPEVAKYKVSILNELTQLFKDMGVTLKPTDLTEEHNSMLISATGESSVNQENIAPE